MEKSKSITLGECHFLVFGEDFQRHPHSLEHLMRALPSKQRVLWVETIGLRCPRLSFYDLKRSFEIIKKWMHLRSKKILGGDQQFLIIAPFLIPFNQISAIRTFNNWNLKKQIQKKISKHSIRNIISITSVPHICDVLGSFHEVCKIYYRVDDFSLWPYTRASLVKSMERKIIKTCNLKFHVSRALCMEHSIYFPHGVDLMHFKLPAKQLNKKNPQIFYFGLIDSRCDVDVISQVAYQIPEAQINVIGDIATDVSNIKRHSNIKLLGKIAYQNLPLSIQNADIFILPYKKNALTNSLNPLKLKEYMATGKPLVASKLPETSELSDYIYIAETIPEWIQILKRIIEGNLIYESEKTLAYLEKSESWEAKASFFMECINNYLSR